MPVEIFFEPSDLLANIRRTSHVKPISDPALVNRRGASYRPGQTHFSRFTAATSLELLFAKFKLLQPKPVKARSVTHHVGLRAVLTA